MIHSRMRDQETDLLVGSTAPQPESRSRMTEKKINNNEGLSGPKKELMFFNIFKGTKNSI